MSRQAPVADATNSVDRLTVRIAQLETANIGLSGIVATAVAAGIFVLAGVTAPHVGRASATQQSLSSCATSKQASAPCRTRKVPLSERIIGV